jgi:hypothetical protein
MRLWRLESFINNLGIVGVGILTSVSRVNTFWLVIRGMSKVAFFYDRCRNIKHLELLICLVGRVFWVSRERNIWKLSLFFTADLNLALDNWLLWWGLDLVWWESLIWWGSKWPSIFKLFGSSEWESSIVRVLLGRILVGRYRLLILIVSVLRIWIDDFGWSWFILPVWRLPKKILLGNSKLLDLILRLF